MQNAKQICSSVQPRSTVLSIFMLIVLMAAMSVAAGLETLSAGVFHVQDHTFMKTNNYSFNHEFIPGGSSESLDRFESQITTLVSGLPTIDEPEVTRHQRWFQEVLGCKCAEHVGNRTRGYFFQSPSPSSVSELEKMLKDSKQITEFAASLGVHLSCIEIDTQQNPNACAVAFCCNCRSAIVGSIGGNRYDYLRIFQHVFYNDENGNFLEDFVANKAIGPVPYRHRPQFSNTTSPLRIDFRTEDLHRGDLGLSFRAGESD